MTQRTFAQHDASKRNLRPRITLDPALKAKYAPRKQYLRQPSTTYTRELAWAKARTAQAIARTALLNPNATLEWSVYAFDYADDSPEAAIVEMHRAMFGPAPRYPFGIEPLPPGVKGDDSWLEFVNAPLGDIPFCEWSDAEAIALETADPEPPDDDEDTVPLALI